MIRKYKFYNKKQADRVLWKIYKRIKSKEVVVRLERYLGKDIWAALDFTEDDAIITIQHDKPIVNCFIHEYLHLIYVGKPESEILRRELELVSLLSRTQIENLVRRLSTLIRHKVVER